jgi:hypothetical protein
MYTSEVIFVGMSADKPVDTLTRSGILDLFNDSIRVFLAQVAINNSKIIAAVANVKHISFPYGKTLYYRHQDLLS